MRFTGAEKQRIRAAMFFFPFSYYNYAVSAIPLALQVHEFSEMDWFYIT